MARLLAVCAPTIGVQSETFIQRHVRDLLPGRTVAIAQSTTGEGYGGHWAAECPVLALEGVNGTWEGRARRVASAIGMAVSAMPWRAVERFVKKHDVQVMLGEYLDASLQWLPLAKRLGIRFFGHAHGYDVSRTLRDDTWRAAYRRYDESDGVIVVNQASRRRLIQLGVAAAKVHVIPCGVDVPDGPKRRPPRDVVRCLAVGRMVAKKAPILTLDAFRRASDACPNLRLDYVGTGELLPAAKQFVRAFNLADRVTLHGMQSNEAVQRLMTEADIFVQHSVTWPDTGDEEGLPVSILEAMAESLPVVSTRHAGIPEAVVDDVTGYLVEENDTAGMADRIVELARNRHLRLVFGVAAWQRAGRQFTWESERAALLKVLGLEGQSGI